MKPLTKDELQMFARTFRDHLPSSIRFSLDGGEAMTAQQLADRLRPLDHELADKVVTWVNAVTGLQTYVTERLGEKQNPLAFNEDSYVLRRAKH
jgi:hypothetical protein